MIRIVIDIPKSFYKKIVDNNFFVSISDFDIMCKAVRYGTPLPKGHGRLIECEPIYDKLIRTYKADKKDYHGRGKDYRVGLSNAIDLLNNAPTIIEADTSKEDRCHKIETETEGYQHQVSDFVEGVETDDNGSCMD